MLTEPYALLGNSLDALVDSMREEGIWPQEMPSAKAMQSTEPFAIDSMPFESWLAFIFVPKMKAIVRTELPIPLMSISPAAETLLSQDAHKTLSVLRELDAIVKSIHTPTTGELH